jgi:hypothetical protein
MGPAGFVATVVDASSLAGNVTLGLARKIGGQIELCNNFSILLYRGDGAPPPATAAPKSEPSPYDPINETVSTLKKEVNVPCEGYIEALNGTPPDPAENMISGTMQVRGWTTISGKDAIVPDAVFIRIVNQQGKTIYIKTRPSPRDDVKRFFGQPKLPDAGFLANIETTKLDGNYTIGVSRMYQGTLERCDELSFPATIRH